MIIHGWTIYVHPLFEDQLNVLVNEVKDIKNKKPNDLKKSPKYKMLAAIYLLAFDEIPKDPSIKKYRLGKSLGSENKIWKRAKFYQQYRLFFRFDSSSKIILYIWVNDNKTKRAYGSKNDAYTVFRKMIDNGSPPNNWEDLLKESKKIRLAE